jgi:hypothetical protein
MASINVRAKNQVIERLKNIAEITGYSQAEVISRSLDILDDFMICKKEMSKEEIEQLPIHLQLIFKKI